MRSAFELLSTADTTVSSDFLQVCDEHPECVCTAAPPLWLKAIESHGSWECLSPCSTLMRVSLIRVRGQRSALVPVWNTFHLPRPDFKQRIRRTIIYCTVAFLLLLLKFETSFRQFVGSRKTQQPHSGCFPLSPRDKVIEINTSKSDDQKTRRTRHSLLSWSNSNFGDGQSKAQNKLLFALYRLCICWVNSTCEKWAESWGKHFHFLPLVLMLLFCVVCG